MRFALAALLITASPVWADEGYARLDGHGGPIKGVAVSADGAFALTASFDNSVGLWSLKDANPQPLWLEGHEAAANTVLFLSGGERVLSAGDDFAAILWDRNNGESVARFEGHQGKILDLAISADGTRAATAGWDGAVGLWNAETGESIAMLKGHRAPVQAVRFAKDGAHLYSASSDGTIRLWDVPNKSIKRVEAKHGFGINRLVINEAAGWLAYGALDGGVRILDIESGSEIADVTSGRQPVLALTLTNDGSLMGIGDGEGFIHIVSTDDWKTVRDFRATARGPVWALAFDGTERVVAGTIQNHADIWPISTATSVAENSAAPQSFLRDPATMSNGERQFTRKCSICHTLTEDGGRRAGPSLKGVFGRRAGTLPGYTFSDALTGIDLVWSDETLDKLFDLGPDHYTPGSKMPMQRIVRDEDRADLIAYLKDVTGTAPAQETKK
jgi:cytochrome c